MTPQGALLLECLIFSRVCFALIVTREMSPCGCLFLSDIPSDRQRDRSYAAIHRLAYHIFALLLVFVFSLVPPPRVFLSQGP